MKSNVLYGIVVATGMVAMSSCGGQGTSNEQTKADSLNKIILADSAVANGTVKIVNDSTARHYITITSKVLPEIDRYETIKGKKYKTEIVLTIGKNMTDDINKDAIYIQEYADYLSVFVEPGNKKYCSRNGVLFTKDMTKIVWYPTNHPGSSYEVPASVKTIGNYAFCWAKIDSIRLPEGLEIIDTSAFANCFALQHIQLPTSVTEIREEAFDMEYEECVDDEEWIEEHSTIAKSIDIPKDSRLERIESVALPFTTHIYLPKTLTDLDDNAFPYNNPYIDVDPQNPKYSSKDGILFNKEQTELISFPKATGGSYKVPNTVRKIGAGAFNGNKVLKQLELNNGLEEIRCLSSLDGLKELKIPASVTNIEVATSCKINVNPANKKYSSLNGVLFSKDKKELIYYPSGITAKNYAVPSSVEEIAAGAFCNPYIEEVYIGERVKKLHKNTFIECYQLKEIELPEELTEIEEDAISCYREEKATATTVHIESDNPPKIGKNSQIKLEVPCSQWETYKKMAKEIGIEEDDICCYVYCKDKDNH